MTSDSFSAKPASLSPLIKIETEQKAVRNLMNKELNRVPTRLPKCIPARTSAAGMASYARKDLSARRFQPRRNIMRTSKIFLAVCAVTMLGAPAFAASDSMGSMKMMEGGEVMAVMPDGHMGTMKMSDEKMMDDMQKMAQPMKGCMMFMTGKDGKTMMVDTSTDAAMKECEKIAK